MTDNEQDTPEVVAPPPLIYLGPLVLGLSLNGRFPVPFLPRELVRVLECSARGDRARGAPPGTQVRRRAPALQSAGTTLDLNRTGWR